MRGLIAFSLVLVLALACKTAEPLPAAPVARAEAPVEAAPPPAPLPMPQGIDEGAMDTAVDPCTDFYRYACGGWLARTEIPEDKSRWSRGFYEIEQRNEVVLREILDQAATGKAPDMPYAEKLGGFYATCMDEGALEQGDVALRAELKKLGAVRNRKTLSAALARLHAQGISPLFAFDSDQSLRDATRVIGSLDQGGLGLPDREYYVSDDEKMKDIREAYRAHVQRMFELLGEDAKKAAASAGAVLDLETALARASLDRVARRNPANHDHPLDRKALKAKVPSFQWDAYFRALGVPGVQDLNMGHPPFFDEVERLIKTTSPERWRAYLSWNLLRVAVPALPRRFQEERFQFEGKVLSGQKVDLPRWKKCVEYTDELLGEALGQAFVARAFGEESKAATRAIVDEIEQAFERNLDSLAWMDDETRGRAREKIRRVVNKIGYPDRWRSYDALGVDRGAFLGNLLRARAFEKSRDLAKIGKPVDRGEWHMSPPTVNAYYSASLNEIAFPAGILQPPFFNPEATAAVNFGAMGMVVGHEFTHGFDDSGRRFDADGNLKDWWTAASDKAFTERAACVKEQYDEVVAIDDLRFNGALTLGENIADLGGVKLAYAALSKRLEEAGRKDGPKYRFTDAQQFFLGYAQSWCSKYRPELARMRVTTDPHAMPFARVNEPLSNLRAFQEAFSCKEGSKMVRAERCELW